MKPKLLVLALIAVVAGAAQPVLGHHGGAAFDQTKTVTMTATMTELRFTNPHVLLFFDVKSEGGEIAKWSGWLTAPTKLSRAGWTKQTLKPGDQVTISGNVHKDGSHVVQIRKLVGPDGMVLPLFEE